MVPTGSSFQVPSCPDPNFKFKISTTVASLENLIPSVTLPSILVQNQTHNFSFSKTFKMEEDCEEHGSSAPISMNSNDINHLFTSFSSQLTNYMDRLQTQLMVNDMKVAAMQETFQQEIWSEMDILRQMVASQPSANSIPVPNPTATPAVIPSSSPLVVSFPTPTSNGPLSSTPPVSGLPSNDVQAQLMLMLTESFSKMTTIMAERSSETKSDWPKLSGDTRKFKSWYLSIVAQISVPPWNEFYDASTNSVVTITVNNALNAKLYAKLLVTLEGQALQDIVSRPHLRANGLLLLQELVQTYKPKNVPEVLAAKAGEFSSKI
jgi:hypothetical protein